MKIRTYKIFTLKLKKYLESIGYECIGVEKSHKNSSYNVFLFRYSDDLVSDVKKYLRRV